MHICFALNQICEHEQLSLIVNGLSPDIRYGKSLYSCRHLAEVLLHDNTDVLIADADFAGEDLFSAIRLIKAHKPLYVILIAPSENYALAYQALKSRVNEILIRPLDSSRVTDALLDASDYLKIKHLPEPAENINARTAFSTEMAAILGNKTVSEINASYSTTFQDGSFRVVSFAVDLTNMSRLDSIMQQIQKILLRFIREKQWLDSYDIVHSIVYNEIRFIFNYDPAKDETLMATFPTMFLCVDDLCNQSPGLDIFMGIGNAYSDINKLGISFRESRNAIWMRMAQTQSPSMHLKSVSERVITYRALLPEDHSRRKIYELDQKIIHAISTLNADQFKESVQKFFTFPSEVLSSSLAQDTLLGEIRFFYDHYREQLASIYGNAKQQYQKAKLRVLSSRTFQEYEQRYISMMEDYFRQLSSAKESSSSENYIYRTINIIRERYMEDLALSDIAEEIHLSATYLSRIFRETTGQSFSDYLLEQRINAAKALLEKTDYRIFDISNSVGYVDQRYFSRIFTKKTGVTPSEYRKIHNVPISQ